MDRNDKRNQSGGQIPRGTHENFYVATDREWFDLLGDQTLSWGGIAVGPQDRLAFNLTSQLNGLTIRAQWRVMLEDGTIIEEKQFFTYNISPNGSLNIFNLPKGRLLGLTVCVAVGTVPHGAASMQVFVGNLDTVNFLSGTTLISDYLVSFYNLAWPGSRILPPTDGQGWQQNLTVGNPAAGTDWSFVFPLNRRVLVKAVGFTLVTDATAGNRQARIQFETSGVQIFMAPAGFAQLPSTTVQYTFAPGLGFNSTDPGAVTAGFPPDITGDITLNNVIRSQFTNKGVGDQFSNIVFRVQTWNENN